MTSRTVSIELDPLLFGERERQVAASGAFRATAFRYRSGVAALRVENGAGSAVFLPFQGQQIWDAEFLGRSLTMRSMFDEPLPTQEYLRTYGAFFIHCGGTSMGNPGPSDTHPLHGELPNMAYQSAQLVFGEDEGGNYVELTGEGRDTLAFQHAFVSRPRLRLYENATAFHSVVEVENRSGKPMPFLYLAHINFRPADGGVLIDTVKDDRTDVVVRHPTLEPDERKAVRDYHAAVAADPSFHRTLVAGVPVEPELVLTMKAASGADGWTYALHRRPDGTGDFVSYRPAELPYAVRWMRRSEEKDALGLVLPATAPPDGLAAAKANGQIVWIEPHGSFRTEMIFGAANAIETKNLDTAIASIRSR